MQTCLQSNVGSNSQHPESNDFVPFQLHTLGDFFAGDLVTPENGLFNISPRSNQDFHGLTGSIGSTYEDCFTVLFSIFSSWPTGINYGKPNKKNHLSRPSQPITLHHLDSSYIEDDFSKCHFTITELFFSFVSTVECSNVQTCLQGNVETKQS